MKPSECPGEERCLGAVIRFKAESHYMMFFVISPVHDVTLPDGTTRREYQDNDAEAWPTLTPNIDDAHCWLQGSVKWDGCMDFTVGQNGFLHTCGLQHTLELGQLISAVYMIAAKNIEAFSPDNAL